MKAIRVHQFGGPDVLRVEDLPDPVPAAGEVLVRLHAVGVNPVEAYVRSGTYALKPPLPYTPGTDSAGVIERLGDGVIDLSVGDRVWVSATSAGRMQGGYAEKAVCPAKHVHPLPERLSFAQGAAINVPYVTAWRALIEYGELQAGQIVLVHGASGGVGTAAVQIATAAGGIVFGTAGTDAGRQLVLDQGAAKAFDHTRPDYLGQIKSATDGRGVNLVIEMLANVNLDKDLGLLADRGRVVIVGSRGRVEIDPRALFATGGSVTGMTYFNGGEPAVLRAIGAVNAGIVAGSYTPAVGPTFPLAEAVKAHVKVMERGATGKVVLIAE
jgi:NADPH2:quinone reductase